MWVERADGTPEFFALRVEEDKGGCELEAVHGGEFPADGFLNIQTDEVNPFADANAIIQFLFEPVNGGLNLGAGNSVGGLKFEQDGCASADQGLHIFGVVHQGGLNGVQDNP